MAVVLTITSLVGGLSITVRPTLSPISTDNAFPVMRIYLDSDNDYGHSRYRGIHRYNRRDAFISMTGTQYEFMFDSAPAEIRGRGNSSWAWFGEKRPYQIRFHDERYILDSDYAARTWTLISNALDATLLRNYAAYYLAGLLRMPFAPNTWNVHLYLNGEYRGVYLLTDQINANDGGRLPMVESDDPTQTEFLFEMCRRPPRRSSQPEGSYWVMVGDLPYTIGFPNDDRIYQNSPHINHFRSLLQGIDDLVGISSNGRIATKAEVAAVMDIDSFVDYYLLQELFKNGDVGFSSVRHQIRIGNDGVQRIVAGPAWDFDISSGSIRTSFVAGEPTFTAPTGVWAARPIHDAYHPAVWFYHLMHKPWFVELVRERWEEIRDNEVRQMLARINYLTTNYASCFNRNFERWDWQRELQLFWRFRVPNEVLALENHAAQVGHFTQWMETRMPWLDDFFIDPAYHIANHPRTNFTRIVWLTAFFTTFTMAIGIATIVARRKLRGVRNAGN